MPLQYTLNMTLQNALVITISLKWLQYTYTHLDIALQNAVVITT